MKEFIMQYSQEVVQELTVQQIVQICRPPWCWDW